MVHRVQCAAVLRGCKSMLMWEDDRETLDEGTLALNGWHLNYGKWVCGAHERLEEK